MHRQDMISYLRLPFPSLPTICHPVEASTLTHYVPKEFSLSTSRPEQVFLLPLRRVRVCVVLGRGVLFLVFLGHHR